MTISSERSGGVRMRVHRLRHPLFCLLAASMVLIIPTTVAVASAPNPTPPRLVSGPDPLPTADEDPHCGAAAGTEFDRSGWEAEATLAVNPANRLNLVAAWMQDWADAIVVGYSTDGGNNWKQVVPPTTICTPGGFEKYENSALDPSLAIAPDGGIVYLSAVAAGNGGNLKGMLVNRSRDGGKTWLNPPKELDTAEFPLYIDWSRVAADPARPRTAYAVWNKGTFPATREQFFARTTDGGENWSDPKQIPSSQPGQLVLGPQILILPDGTLVDVFAEIPAQPASGLTECPHGPMMLLATRSTDGGDTWSTPTTIAADPSLLAGSAAVAPDGTIYASWAKDASDETGRRYNLMYSKSTDGGQTWSDPEVIADEKGPPEPGNTVFLTAFPTTRCMILAAPSLAVAADGTVGVAFYDHRNDDPRNDPPKVTDFWFRHSHDGGSSWQETHLAGPFDQTYAPTADGGPGGPGFLGDYQGMTAIGNGFGAAFVLAQPLPGANFKLGDWPSPDDIPTDVFFVRVR